MNTATLSFEIESERLVAEEYPVGETGAAAGTETPYLSLVVHPLINGQRLTSEYAVNVRMLLAYGARDANLDIYTCSCGVAGCAGIFDDVRLEVGLDTVQWVFPEKPFRQKFPRELFPADAPLVVRFQKNQYIEALSAIENQLYELTLSSELPLALLPETYPDLSKTIGEELAGARNWADTTLTRVARRKDLFKHLYNAALEIVWPNGARRRAWVTTLADNLAYQVAEARHSDLGGDNDSRADILENEIVPALLSGEASLTEKLKELDWSEVRTLLWRVGDGPKPPQAYGWEGTTCNLVLDAEV